MNPKDLTVPPPPIYMSTGVGKSPMQELTLHITGMTCGHCLHAVNQALTMPGVKLEARAKGRTSGALRRLISLRPPTARVLREGAEVGDPAGSAAGRRRGRGLR